MVRRRIAKKKKKKQFEQKNLIVFPSKESSLMAEKPQTSSSTSHTSSTKKSPDVSLKQPQVPMLSGFPSFPNGDFQMLPIMYPALLTPSQNQEHVNRGAGIYAVPVHPFMGPVAGVPSNTLIPLTYNIPTRTSTEGGAVGEGRGQDGQQQQRQHQQPAPQRQARRFQIAFQLDLLLILKLAAVIFLFNQDGSRQRLAVLVFFASLVYLYQTGALTPLVRWLSQGMHRAAVPPHQQRPAVRAENVPPAARQGIENHPLGEGQPGVENENRPAEDGNPAVENENVAEPDQNDGNQWWGIVKEIQMIVFGFITSLLPGFHNID